MPSFRLSPFALALALVWSSVSCDLEPPPIEDAKGPFSVGEPFSVGYMSYTVKDARWTTRAGEFGDSRSNARSLELRVEAKNNDQKARVVPPFYLVNIDGSRHQTSGTGSLDFEDLNPGVSKTGTVLFEVVMDSEYQLMVGGDYFYGTYAIVDLALD